MNKYKSVLTAATLLSLGVTLVIGTTAFAADSGEVGNVRAAAGVNAGVDRGTGAVGAGAGMHDNVSAGANAPMPSVNGDATVNSEVVPSTAADRATEHAHQKAALKEIKRKKKLKKPHDADGSNYNDK